MTTYASVRGGGILVFGVMLSLVAFATLTAVVCLSPACEHLPAPELSTIAPFSEHCDTIRAAARAPWDDIRLDLSNDEWRPALHPCEIIPGDPQIRTVSKPRRGRGLFRWLKKRRQRTDEPVIPQPPAPESINRNSGLRMGLSF